jgi:ABC-type sugar transport system substrate-binding protein
VGTWRAPVAALAVVLLAAGCGASVTRTGGSAVLLVAGRKFDFVRDLAIGFSHGVESVGGVAHEELGPDDADNAREWKDLQAYRDGRHGSVSLFTLAPELFAGSLAQVSSAGTPLVALHSAPAQGSGVDLFVGNDNLEVGRRLAGAVARQIPAGSAGLVVLGSPSPGVRVLDDRITGARAELLRLRPRLQVIGPFDTKLDPAKNLQAWRDLEAASPQAIAFVGAGGADSHSLALLAEKPGRVDGAVGADPQSLARAKIGRMVLVSTEPYLQGWLAGVLQARGSRTGDKLPAGWLVVPSLLVDAANAGEIATRQSSPAQRAAWFGPKADMILRDLGDYLRPMEEAV